MHRNHLAAALLGTTALLAAATAAVAQQATTPVQPGINAPATGAAGLNASVLRDKPVHDAAGQEIGRVASVVVGTDNQAYAVVRGGLFGTRQVLVPVSRLGYQNDRFVAGGYNEEQFRALPVYTAGAADYRDADDTVGLNVTGYTAAAGGTQTAQGRRGHQHRRPAGRPGDPRGPGAAPDHGAAGPAAGDGAPGPARDPGQAAGADGDRRHPAARDHRADAGS
jgi:hypothetical protein